MKKSLTEKLAARQAATREIIHALQIAADRSKWNEENTLRALALRIEKCGSINNTYIAKDAWNHETGEAYDAIGQLWQCNSKLCVSCLATHARRNRKKLNDAINRQRLQHGERYSFVTFTIPNPNKNIMVTRSIVDRAWGLFRKRKLCVSLIRGGAKSEEFTLTANGYHYHLHCIFLSKWLSYQEIRRLWTECVETAFAEAGIAFKVDTADGYCIVKVKPVSDLNGAIHEVCKYITKSDSWYKMRESDLIDLAMIKRWFRMFEMFGSFADRDKDRESDLDEQSEDQTIVHTRNLSDGSASHSNSYWRDVIEEQGFERYKMILEFEIEQTQKARIKDLSMRWPGVHVIRATDDAELRLAFETIAEPRADA